MKSSMAALPAYAAAPTATPATTAEVCSTALHLWDAASGAFMAYMMYERTGLISYLPCLLCSACGTLVLLL